MLPGWRIKRGDVELSFSWVEFQKHSLLPDDPANRLRGDSFGLRLAGRPLVRTYARHHGSRRRVSLIDRDQQFGADRLRLADPRTCWRELVCRTEIQYFGSDGYRHLRLGAHITSMKADNVEWSAAAGWAGVAGPRRVRICGSRSKRL